MLSSSSSQKTSWHRWHTVMPRGHGVCGGIRTRKTKCVGVESGRIQSRYIITHSMAVKAMGCAACESVHRGTARSAQMQEAKKIVHPVRSSRLGSRHADTKVGMEPMITMMMLVTRATTGLLSSCHRTMADMAPPRQHLSSTVHPCFPRFNASAATIHDPMNAPTICPFTACFTSIVANKIESSTAQIIHDVLAGFVLPLRIASMYGR